MEYEIIRTRRKSVAIHILPDGKMQVRAPLYVNKKEIERFVKSKSDWIEQTSGRLKYAKNLRETFSIKAGDDFLLCGKYYAVKVGKKAEFDGTNVLLPELDWQELMPVVKGLYKQILKKVLDKLVNEYQEKLGVKATKISVTSAQRRWGSCSYKNGLNFSFMLAMADMDEIIYVVVHELCHIKQKNHSKQFYDLVKSVLPNYKENEQNLKELHCKIMEQNWK